MSTKAFCLNAPSISNDWYTKILSTFKRTLKTELFDIAYGEREQSA